MVLLLAALASGEQAQPDPGLMEKLMTVYAAYHYTPKVLADGRSHHFYIDQEDEATAVNPPSKAANIVEFFKDLHAVPRAGDDGKLHFWYSEPKVKEEIVTIYRSDISDTPLEFGKFYHKLGAAYDISDKEYHLLSSAGN